MPKEKKKKKSYFKNCFREGKKYKCKLDCDVIGGKVVRMW